MIDRRQLKREYLETKTHAGVYVIRNRVTGRTLVDGGLNVRGALNRHRFELQLGKHRNTELLRDWQEYGESNFEFEVLDQVKFRDEPGFDVTRELEALIALWREEVLGDGGLAHGQPTRVSSNRE